MYLLLQVWGKQYEGHAEDEARLVVGFDDSPHLDQRVIALDVERHPHPDCDPGARARDDPGTRDRYLHEVGRLRTRGSTVTLSGDGGCPRDADRRNLDSLA
jgi:hypothetical protein